VQQLPYLGEILVLVCIVIPPSCSMVGTKDGCSAEMSKPIDVSQTFNIVMFGQEGRGIELAFDAEMQWLRVCVGFLQIISKNNLQVHLEMHRIDVLNVPGNHGGRYPFHSEMSVVIGGVNHNLVEINLGA